MVKLRVEFKKDVCVGNGICAAVAPHYFELLERKATLKNAQYNGGDSYLLEGMYGDDEAQVLITAAQGCPVNAIRITDLEKKSDIVSNELIQDGVKTVIAEYDDIKEFTIDTAGYFLIRLDRINKTIEVGFCNEKNKLVLKVTGKKPIDIYTTLLNKEQLPIRKDHAAYLGRELHKAYTALCNGLEYVQDDELDFTKKIS